MNCKTSERPCMTELRVNDIARELAFFSIRCSRTHTQLKRMAAAVSFAHLQLLRSVSLGPRPGEFYVSTTSASTGSFGWCVSALNLLLPNHTLSKVSQQQKARPAIRRRLHWYERDSTRATTAKLSYAVNSCCRIYLVSVSFAINQQYMGVCECVKEFK